MKTSRVLLFLAAILAMGLLYWLWLPAVNLHSLEFCVFLLISLGILLLPLLLSQAMGYLQSFQVTDSGKVTYTKAKSVDPRWGKVIKYVLLSMAAILVLMVIAGIYSAPIFHASTYKDLINPVKANFTEDVAEISMSQVPVVDRDTATRLGARKLGEMSDLVSQFEIASYYTQINVKGRPVRVTPLIYGDLIKWFNNQSKGIPAYIQVDMVTQDTKLVRLEKGMKYGPSELFMRDLTRYLRFAYPTKIFGRVSFEIDDEGMPYWVVPTITYKVGLWGGQDVSGAILLNAVTGEHVYYDVEDIPAWIDEIYEAALVLEQLNFNGKFQSGYWNSIFGQRGVLQTTEGYNYLAIGDDVYLYTGMTSVGGDESNVGFVLVNLRTKDTRFYEVAGAEEFSAMDSAQGQVQHLGYTATFPLLLNISDRPTYFMSLKDAAGLVKMYAFVDVQQYQVVGTGATVEEALANYSKALQDENISDQTPQSKKTGVIADIQAVVRDGNTHFYFKLEGDDTIYIAPISLSPKLPFYVKGDTITFGYQGTKVVSIE